MAYLLGIDVDSSLYATDIGSVLRNLDQTDVLTFAIGLATIAIVVGLKRLNRAVPGALVAVILTTALVWLADLDVETVGEFASGYGFIAQHDLSGSNIEVQIIDTSCVTENCIHPELDVNWDYIKSHKPVLLVMDYAFGAQAYEVMDELLSPCFIDNEQVSLRIESISIMGKAGILPGKKGDIMLATAHVMEGTPHNYILENDLCADDFGNGIAVYSGPMVTVLGTSLQNRDVLERFHSSSWRAIGLEMEGGHYQRAINAAVIQGHIPKDLKIRYAYYASDNPLISGETLASGPMGTDGIVPTYLISKVIIQKILSGEDEEVDT